MEETEYYLKIMRRIYLRECRQFVSLLIFLTIILLITCLCYILYTKRIKQNKIKRKLTPKKIKKIEKDIKDKKLKAKIGCVFLTVFICVMYLFCFYAFKKNINKILYDINNTAFEVYEGGFTIDLIKKGKKDLLMDRDEGRVIFDTTDFYYDNSYYECLLLDVKGKGKIYDDHSVFSFYKKYYGIIVYGSHSKKVVYWDVDVYEN